MGTPEAINLAQTQAREDANKLIGDVLHRAHCEGVQHKTWVQLGMGVGETLRAFIEREHIDLAVVGTHGKTGLVKLVMGSVAEDVFRHASCPVLTVGPHSWRSDSESVHLKHILFPTDLSSESVRALPITIAIAQDFDAALTFLTVMPHLQGEATHDKRRVEAALEKRMREIVSAYAPLPAKTAFEVRFADVAESVVEAVEDEGIDLISFGLKAPDTYSDRVPWMHAYKIVCEARCPVLSLCASSSDEEH